MDELLSEFVAETQESLEALSHVVVVLEADPSDRTLLDQLFRFFHTVKGSCGFLNLPRFERLSHAAEDVLSDYRSGGTVPDAATISAVLAVMDRIGELCVAVHSGDSLPDRNDEQLIATLLHCHAMAKAALAQTAKEDDAASASPADPLSNAAEWTIRVPPASRTVRLPLLLIDQLMNGVSDMVLARNELARKLRASGAEPETDAAFERLSTCIADMRDTISKTRMQRVDRLFMAIPRMVRDLSRELGKTITLSIEGGDVEMDREMVEMVIDPLTHIVRNSIDHGIETPEQRAAAGKPEVGSLRLSAYQSGSQIVIEVVDDGRGIDPDAVVARIQSAGLLNERDIARMSEQEKIDLIFMPGVSTASKITSISGRGVGMDIVRANIERIGGVISLNNDKGRGLAISIRVPLTLTIIPGLILNAGGMNFAIPRSAVIEILHDNNAAVSVARLGGGVTATIRNVRYSMIDLEDVIGLPKEEQCGPRSLMVVRSSAGTPYILAVSQVENHEELVIRPAAPVVMATGIYAGMTLPDNGQPMLLLDAGGIAEVASLPLVAEAIDAGSRADADTEREVACYPGLRFVELSGQERVIRLSLVERVEDIALDHFMTTAGQCRVQINGRLVPSPHAIDPDAFPSGQKDVTCLRIRDGVRDLCYPIRSIIDINDVPADIDHSVRYGLVGGLALIDGKQVEVIDAFALMAAMGDSLAAPAERAVRCVLPDDDDIWNREILAPLLMQAGYDVTWAERATDIQEGDVLFLTEGTDPQPHIADSPAATIRLRTSTEPQDALDDSIYRYDREALLNAVSSIGHRRKQA